MVDLQGYNMILASKSPQRSSILRDGGYSFEIVPSNIEEHLSEDLDCAQNTLKLSFDKAMSSFNQLKNQNLLKGKYLFVGSDSIVYYDEKIYGKPKDRGDAFNMLSTLSNTTHQVITGVSIVAIDTNAQYQTRASLSFRDKYSIRHTSFFDRSFVTFKNLQTDEINSWLDQENFLDKAGSYAIQGGAQGFVKRVEGDIQNVVGFPLTLFEKELENFIKE
ncbi:MAG: Maf family protein [Coriobacteriales bacterium]|nr:Maf family protein [Coriobacteriales bacterium]